MCTVLLRWRPGARWPLLFAAIRDEFLGRAWDRTAAHWPELPGVVGGRDRTAGGTWLAVRRDQPAVAAVLNGARQPPAQRPSRGGLPLAALAGDLPSADELRRYDGFHLLLGTPQHVRLWSWDGVRLDGVELAPGDHVVVNLGADRADDPLVPLLAPRLRACPDPPLDAPTTAEAWGDWVALLRGDEAMPPDDGRALIKQRVVAGQEYGSSSASLVAISPTAVRFDFTATPQAPAWSKVG